MTNTVGARAVVALWLLRRRPVAWTAALGVALTLTGMLAALAWPHPEPLAARLPTGPSPVAVAVAPGSRVIYAASLLGEAVTVLDRRSGRPLGTIALAGQPAALAVDATHHRLYVAGNDATLTVVDTLTQSILATLPAGSQRLPASDLPFQIAADPSTGYAYVPDTDDDAVAVVAADQTLMPSFPVGHRPVAVAVDPVRQRLYAANAGDGTVSVLASRSGAPLATVPVGGVPAALAVDPGADRVYVADFARSQVAELDASTLRVIARVPVAPFPITLAVNPSTHHAYVAHAEADGLTVLSGTTDTVIGVLPVGQRPAAITVDPDLARVYVANEGGDDLAVLLDRPGGAPAILVKGAPPEPSGDCADRCVEAIHAHE